MAVEVFMDLVISLFPMLVIFVAAWFMFEFAGPSHWGSRGKRSRSMRSKATTTRRYPPILDEILQDDPIEDDWQDLGQPTITDPEDQEIEYYPIEIDETGAHNYTGEMVE